MRAWSYLVLGTALLTACGRSSRPAATSTAPPPSPRSGSPAAAPKTPPPPPTALTLAELGIDGMDPSANPCTDFYRFACGAYAAKSPPTGHDRWSRSDDASAAAATVVARALAPLQAACLDDHARSAAGLEALRPLRRAAAAVHDEKSLAAALGLLHRYGVAAGFSVAAAPDFRDGRTIILHLDQAGALTLGDRDHYMSAKDALDGAKQAAQLRKSYEDRVRALLQAGGRSPADARAAARDVMKVESALARAARSRYERRAPELLYDRVDRAGLAKLAPHVDWRAYFTALGRADVDGISVTSQRYLQAFDHLTSALPATAWRAYLDFHALFAFAADATPELAHARAEILALIEPLSPPETPALTCTRAIADALPDRAAAAVMAPLSGDARQRLDADVSAIRAAMAENARAAGWMTAATRARAGAKLAAVDLAIGFEGSPDGAAPGGSGYLSQMMAARARETSQELASVGSAGPGEPDALAAAARYQWLGNRVILPPAALVYPAARAPAPASARLGALAFGAGHELFHAIDDHGALWNQRGGMASWWQESDRAGWRERGGCFVAWAQNHKLASDGAAVADEMRADAAGLAAAFRAYRSRAASDGPFHVTGPSGAAIAPDQLFFIAAANAQCTRSHGAERPEAGRPTARARIDAAVAASADFAAAFSCPAGAPLHPAEACEVW